MTSIERIGITQALQESMIEVLKVRFNNVPCELIEQLKKIYDIDRKQLVKQASITISISELG